MQCSFSTKESNLIVGEYNITSPIYIYSDSVNIGYLKPGRIYKIEDIFLKELIREKGVPLLSKYIEFATFYPFKCGYFNCCKTQCNKVNRYDNISRTLLKGRIIRGGIDINDLTLNVVGVDRNNQAITLGSVQIYRDGIFNINTPLLKDAVYYKLVLTYSANKDIERGLKMNDKDFNKSSSYPNRYSRIISGTVTDTNGNLVENATVLLRANYDDNCNDTSTKTLAYTTTNANGFFLFNVYFCKYSISEFIVQAFHPLQKI